MIFCHHITTHQNIGGTMQKILFTIVVVSAISSLGFAEMKLKLHSDFMEAESQTIFTKNLQTNLKLSIPEQITPPADMKEFVKGMMILGILGDVSFPMGSDSGFKHVAGTGFSGHAQFGYFLSPVFLLALRAGYISFGTQTEEGSEQGYTYKYEDSFSQIPILLGAYYVFATGSSFKPYLGVAFGVFFQTYSVKWQESGYYDFNLDDSFSNTGFGIVPAAGFYLLMGSVVLQAAVEYTLMFTEGPKVEYNYNYSLEKVSNITQETYTEETDKASYISVNVGVSFSLGQ
jgi:outer membrane protein W